MIAIPAFVFVFLEFFGENVYHLRYLYPVKENRGSDLFWDPSGLPLFDEGEFLGKPNGDTTFLRIPDRLVKTNGKAVVLLLLPGIPDEEIRVLTQRMMVRLGKKNLKIQNLSMEEPIGQFIIELAKEQGPQLSSGQGLILLIDRDGYFRGSYLSPNPKEHDRVIIEIEILLSIKNG